MIKIGVCAAFVATALTVGPAMASVTIANQDAKTHTIIINRGSIGEKSQDVASGRSVQTDCPQKCGIRVETYGFTRMAGGDDRLIIDKDEELHLAGGHGDLQMPNGTD